MRAAVVSVLVLGLAGCSALLHPETYMIACSGVGTTDTCGPFGMMCVGGYCQTIVPSDGGTAPDGCGAQESCNGLDDNCNGLIDEDPSSDRDHDAYTFCGTVSGTIPGPLSPDHLDCDDTDPTVYPGASELCDGKDNDCNHMVDDGADASCAPGQTCSASVHACRVPDCTLIEHPCAAGMICDTSTLPATCVDGTDCRHNPGLCTSPAVCNTTTGVCTTPGPLGSACVEDTDCASGACFDALALEVLSSSPRICGQACCTDSQCPEGSVCWTPGSGARSCLPASRLSRTMLGSTESGASCSGDAECRSGLCGAMTDGCVASCRSSTACASGQACGPTLPVTTSGITDYRTLSCVTRTGTHHGGERCCGDDECTSGVCYGNGDFFGTCVPGTCVDGCGTNADCARAWTGATGYCGYLVITYSTGPSIAVPMCNYLLPGALGSDPTGASCTDGASCASDFCDTSTGVCRDTCCTDADCQASHTLCRPGTGTYATMRCR